MRSLAEDLGAVLGCGAHVSRLHRCSAGGFKEAQSTSLEALQTRHDEGGPMSLDELLLPVDAAIADRPVAVLDDRAASLLLQGQAVLSPEGFIPDLEADIVRVFDENQNFMGVAQITGDNSIKPKRLIAK